MRYPAKANCPHCQGEIEVYYEGDKLSKDRVEPLISVQAASGGEQDAQSLSEKTTEIDWADEGGQH